MSEINNAYIGQKGYTLLKKNITPKQERFLRKELTVKPFIPKSLVKPEEFPVYKESSSKFYIPRFWGLKTYGNPGALKISEGDNIDIAFSGSLRDYQETIVKTYMETVSKDQFNTGGLLEIPCGRGKTVLSLKIIAELKKKTLVIVHKGFLLNQWVERIHQFLPNARIGKIQGPVIDINDKDIVIGMLQSLSMKYYPNDMFESFGLTIVDEVHHISSKVFSRSLMKIITKYTLGLSATMNRKDGLSKVFKMFLGEIVYKEVRKNEDNVLVKAIEYEIEDEEFNKTEYDYRGNAKYSTMMSKLCNYNRRSEFILNVIKNELNHNPNQQMIVLAHYRNLLKYLHDAIEHRNIASVGYYVGGMKEKDLKISETKQVIIATYSMAAEALDIKSLTTLCMATPKTDITQAIGRILRTKHTQPLVIDIIDHQDIFQKQWKKRTSYYHKQKYKIIKTHCDTYEKNIEKEGYDAMWDEIKPRKRGRKKVYFDNTEDMVGKCLIKL
jgi:superfamily II DNA or RNA helicase